MDSLLRIMRAEEDHQSGFGRRHRVERVFADDVIPHQEA
jgi:hypothetical protein